MNVFRHLTLSILLGCTLALCGCIGSAYVFEQTDVSEIRDRAESRVDTNIRVSAAVLGRQESQGLFGVDLYAQGIQPVWLEIENTGSTPARYAPVSTDSYYFSPLEVAYKNRSGLSDEGRSELERRLEATAMPRYIDPGETRSGFVFTHAVKGAKGFNVDVFGSTASHSFTFLLRVPGFVPDYANFDAVGLYPEKALVDYQGDKVIAGLQDMPCCSTDKAGKDSGNPINLVVIGSGRDTLKALLRSGWLETSSAEAAEAEAHYLFGRSQDAIFRYESVGGESIYEIRFWLAPLTSDQEEVWLGEARHFYAWRSAFPRFDPDVDNARDFTIQKFIYGQALRSLAWLSGTKIVPAESLWDRLLYTPYFSDGSRPVLWLSAEPYSVSEIEIKDWDKRPGAVE
jgi:hypothetical protein